MKTIIYFLAMLSLIIPRLTIAQVTDVNTQDGKEIGFTLSKYRYEEPGVMYLNGFKFGIDASEIITFKNFWYLRSDGRLAGGLTDYFGTGTMENILDIYYEGRLLLGKDFQIDELSIVSPFFGLGGRVLFNDLRGITSTGRIGYRRLSTYFYIPVGIIHRIKLKEKVILSTTLEFDHLVIGSQKSYLSDLLVGCSDVVNIQRNGFGLKVSSMYEKNNWSVGPFLHYWNIEQSDYAITNVMNDVTTASFFWVEPHNYTAEFGIRLSYKY